jgi:hypothetical protein
LGEDSVAVFLKGLCVLDRKYGKSPEGIDGIPDVDRSSRIRITPASSSIDARTAFVSRISTSRSSHSRRPLLPLIALPSAQRSALR